MKLGIVINTYQKSDGTTKQFLIRALESVKSQTYKNYKVFLIGDNYGNNNEFYEIAKSIIPSEKIYYENLPYAKERDKYLNNNHAALWNSGGCNARNYGNDIAKLEVDYVCQLDHDDYYLPNHLTNIVNTIDKYPDAAFVYTLATNKSINSFPKDVNVDGSVIESLPKSARLIHSSVCINNKKIPLKYRDVFEEDGVVYPSDADLWERIRVFCNQNSMKSYLVCEVSCIHDTERGTA